MKIVIAVILFIMLVMPVGASVIQMYFLYDSPADTDTAGSFFGSSGDKYFTSSGDKFFVSN